MQDFRLEDGSKPEVVALPTPAPLYFDGDRLPASYANFYISNAAVIVPTFNDPQDRIALGLLRENFSRIAWSPASTPWTSCSASERCTASRSSSRHHSYFFSIQICQYPFHSCRPQKVKPCR